MALDLSLDRILNDDEAHTKSVAFPVLSSRKLTSFELRYVATVSQLIFLGISCADIFPNQM